MKKLTEIWSSLNIWWRAIVIAVVSPIGGFLAIFSAIEALFKYNIVTELLNKLLPHSYIYMGILSLLIFLVRLLMHFIQLSQNNVPSGSDQATLNSMNEVFPKQAFRGFIDYLADSRAVALIQLEEYHLSVNRFTERNYTLSNKKLEAAKMDFLQSLAKFINYTGEHFDTILNSRAVKFKGVEMNTK